MRRRDLLVGGVAAVGAAGVVVGAAASDRPARAESGASGAAAPGAPWRALAAPDGPGVVETVARMAKGESCAAVVQRVRARIAAVDRSGPALRAVLALNPDLDAIAQKLDARLDDAHRKSGAIVGPLHGVPIVVKDNVDTADKMPTTAGSLALAKSQRNTDAPLVKRLRDAGAVVVGKSNLSEWANFRGDRSVSGWSGVGGQTRNPYVLDRTPSGSSSGSAAAVAAGIVPAAIGTETDGSIVSPSSTCGIVGFKPTRGAVSGKGIVPISVEQDTAGPMARTVADAALVFSVMREPRASSPSAGSPVAVLDGATLQGKRVGVARKLAGFHRDVDACFDAALAAMQKAGAVLVDVPLANPPGLFDAEFLALTYEAKRDIDTYLRSLSPPAPGITGVADVVAFDAAHFADELALFGDQTFAKALVLGPLTSPEYVAARASANKLAADALTASLHGVDVIVCPTEGPAWLIDVMNGDAFSGGQSSSLPAVAGTPHCTVPMGFARGLLPVGLSFLGAKNADDDVLRYAHAFEQAMPMRKPPEFLPTIRL